MGESELRSLGPALKSIRDNLGISAKELAGNIGVSASYLSEIETGKRPLTEAFARKVAGALKADPAEFRASLASFDSVVREPVSYRSGPLRMPPADITFNHPFTTPEPNIPDPFRELAEYFVTSMPVNAAWDLVRSLTVTAQSGDLQAARRAKALLEILSSPS